jgi:hypothetical protein
MPLSKLVFKPGINKDQTDYASEGGWYYMDKVRFRSGFPEKYGGWTVKTFDQYVGSARSIFTWTTTDGSRLVAVGTNQKIYVNSSTALYDITPLRITYIHSSSPSSDNCFRTTSGSNLVQILNITTGIENGEWVTFSGVTNAVGGVPASNFNKEFQINIIGGTPYITVATTATSNATSTGNTNITAAFQINIGNSITTLGYGWGAGAWSRGTWGSGSIIPLYFYPRLEFFQNNYNDLIFNIYGSDIYYWAYDPTFTSRSVKLSSLPTAVAVPQQVNITIFASSGYYVALGCTNYDPTAPAPDYLGTYDPLLIRWANVDPVQGPQPEIWQPTLTNTAGFLRLQSGSRIIAAVNSRQEMLIFTDTSLTSMQFLGTQEVFGLQELSHNISILGPNTAIGINNVTYWMGRDKFFTYSGRVDALPCTLRQYIFNDINYQQSQIFFAGTNNEYNEIIWFYCSQNSNEIDRYVVYNYNENIWYYGNLERTAWIDQGAFTKPLAFAKGWVYNQEDGPDDGQPLGAPPLPLVSYIQSADVDIDDGDKYMLLRRIIPDVNFSGSETTNPVTGATITPQAVITVGVRNFPGAASSSVNSEGQVTADNIVTSSATIDQYTNQVFIRARGRQMNFRIQSNDVGTQWQLGMPRIDARPDGMRN